MVGLGKRSQGLARGQGEAIQTWAEGRGGLWRELEGATGATSYPVAARGASTGTRCRNANFGGAERSVKKKLPYMKWHYA